NRTVSSLANGTSVHESETPYRTAAKAPVYDELPISTPKPHSVPRPITITADEPDKAQTDVIDGVHADFRLVGEAMKTYIIVEKGTELLLIDKHAAHERMIFDRLKKQEHGIMSQSLLVPVTVKLSDSELELIEKNCEALESLGFEIEPYGTDSAIVRSVPADTDASDIPPMVEEICDKLKKGSSLSKEDVLDEILHTVACKAAVKAGWNTEDDEILEIVKAVVSGEVKYCPHGRPVAMTLTKKQLDKEFSRIV
ncbi:MAG: DNA mismatch repair protein MutL, partial [Oscillospiraceae bacterium]